MRQQSFTYVIYLEVLVRTSLMVTEVLVDSSPIRIGLFGGGRSKGREDTIIVSITDNYHTAAIFLPFSCRRIPLLPLPRLYRNLGVIPG